MENQQEIIIPQKDVAPVLPNESTSPNTPKFSNTVCNMAVVRLLKPIYAGRYSVLTILATNIYGQIISSGNAALISTLSSIANDDLTHLRLLGNAIIALGGNARFTNGQGISWSARNINYPRTTADLVRSIIRDKENENQNLQSAISRITDESLKSLLNNIYNNNMRHIGNLQPFLNA